MQYIIRQTTTRSRDIVRYTHFYRTVIISLKNIDIPLSDASHKGISTNCQSECEPTV